MMTEAAITSTVTTTPSSLLSYQNKAVISLEGRLIGYVTGEDEVNKMMIINDDETGNKFIIPSCKVISVDNTKTNHLIVDIELCDAVNYKITS